MQPSPKYEENKKPKSASTIVYNSQYRRGNEKKRGGEERINPRVLFPVIQLYWYGLKKAALFNPKATQCFVNIPAVSEEKS